MTPDIDAALRISAGLLTPLVALVAGYVALRQYHLGRQNFRLALYEKRFAIYRGTIEFMAGMLIAGDVSAKEISDFHSATRGAVFLFNSDIADFLFEVDKRAMALHHIKRIDRRSMGADAEAMRRNDKEAEILEWVQVQHSGIDARFKPFLALKRL